MSECGSFFPVIIETENSLGKFQLIESPSDLPVGISFVICDTNADEEMLKLALYMHALGFERGCDSGRPG